MAAKAAGRRVQRRSAGTRATAQQAPGASRSSGRALRSGHAPPGGALAAGCRLPAAGCRLLCCSCGNGGGTCHGSNMLCKLTLRRLTLPSLSDK